MSLLKHILGAFVELKDGGKDVEAAATAEVKTQAATPATGAAPPAIVPAPATTAGNHAAAGTTPPDQYQKHFLELIDEANKKNPLFQGTDFKEFIDSKADVEGIGDEPTRYRTTFNVLKRTGLTKEKLLMTGREYINLIDKDVKAFEDVYLDQYKTQVERKEQMLQQKAQELQTLNEKIEMLNKEMKQLSQDVLTGKDKLVSNRNAFVAAADNIKREIDNELNKIEQFFS